MKVYVIDKKLTRSIIAGVLAICVAAFLVVLAPIYQTVFNVNKILPIYNVQTNEKKVALSFDAAWGADDTPLLLNALKKHNAKATFFLVGKWAEKYPNETKAISNAGHEIGNHSYKHPDMTKISESSMKEEIEKANQAIEMVTGKKVTVYRPPFGAYNNTTMRVLDSLHMHTIQWDVDSLDWKDLTAEQIVARVVPKVQPGSIVLFHNNAKHTAEALPTILAELKKQGYQFVTVSELIIKDRSQYYIDHKGTQIPKTNNEIPAEQNKSLEESTPSTTTPPSQHELDPDSEDVFEIIDTTT